MGVIISNLIQFEQLFPRLNIIIYKGFRWYGLNGPTWYQFINDAPLGLASGIEGKKNINYWFYIRMQIQGAFFSSQKKEGGWELQYEFRKKITNMNSSEINLHKPKKKAINADSSQNGV